MARLTAQKLTRPDVVKKALTLLSALFVFQLLWMWYPSGEDYAVGVGVANGNPAGAGGLAGEEDRREGMENGQELTRAYYDVIARGNIFNSMRGERWPEQSPPRQNARNTPVKKSDLSKIDGLVLEGIVVFDDNYIAYIRNMRRPQEPARNVQVGDTVEDFKVVSITEEELTFKGDDGTTKVLNLYSSEKPRRSGLRSAAPAPAPPEATAPQPGLLKPKPRNMR